MKSNISIKAIIAAAKAIWLPVVTFVCGALIMTILSGHGYVTAQLREKAAPEDQSQLHARFQGYNTSSVDRHWGALDRHALAIQRRFLQLDLVFPLFYGWAFAMALLRTWNALGKPLPFLWLGAPVAITVIADWIENLVQLAQLHLYMELGKSGLDAGWIQIASTATTVKLFFFSGTLLLLIGLGVRPVFPVKSSKE